MKSLILTVEDTQKIVHHVGINRLMDEMIERLTTAFSQYDETDTVVFPRDGFTYSQPRLGLVEWMPVMKRGDKATIKLVGYHPDNPRLQRLPTILSTITAFDTSSGHLIGIMDGTFLTALRTGATSAVASRVMAHPNSCVVGLIGCGAQAITQLHAVSRIFDLTKVLIFDIDQTAQQSFHSRASFMNIDIHDVQQSSLPELVKSSDILCTATSVGVDEGPVFSDCETKSWLHVNAVGSDFPGKTEVPMSFLRRSFVCPEFFEQATKEGECQLLSSNQIGPTLVEILKSPSQYEHVQNRLSVFDSTGWALEDQVASDIFFAYAARLDLGTWVQIEHISEDPKNPYQFLNQKTRPGHTDEIAATVN